jgi:hypothetical protein
VPRPARPARPARRLTVRPIRHRYPAGCATRAHTSQNVRPERGVDRYRASYAAACVGRRRAATTRPQRRPTSMHYRAPGVRP